MVMWNDILTDREIEEIGKHLPDVASFQRRTSKLTPTGVSLNIMLRGSSPDMGLPIAAVCFVDLGNTLWAANYALYQCLAHGCYHRKSAAPHAEIEALFFEKYYADDAALRLYSAGEHLANAILHMLGISSADLQPFRKGRISRQGALARYLDSQKQDHPVARAISVLGVSADWKAALRYRNKWVHEQPPLVDGLGLQFRRRCPLEVSENGRMVTLGLGGGDPPDHTMDDVKSFLGSALRQLLAASGACLDYYESELCRHA